LEDLRRRVAAHRLVETGPDVPRVYAVGFGANGRDIDIEVFAPILSTTDTEFLDVQEAIILDILAGVEASESVPTDRTGSTPVRTSIAFQS